MDTNKKLHDLVSDETFQKARKAQTLLQQALCAIKQFGDEAEAEISGVPISKDYRDLTKMEEEACESAVCDNVKVFTLISNVESLTKDSLSLLIKLLKK